MLISRGFKPCQLINFAQALNRSRCCWQECSSLYSLARSQNLFTHLSRRQPGRQTRTSYGRLSEIFCRQHSPIFKCKSPAAANIHTISELLQCTNSALCRGTIQLQHGPTEIQAASSRFPHPAQGIFWRQFRTLFGGTRRCAEGGRTRGARAPDQSRRTPETGRS